MRRTDRVLELGVSFGDATAVLAAQAQYVRGVDNSPTCVTRATARVAEFSEATIHLLDALGNPAQLIALGEGCSVIFCDLGGDRDLSLPYVRLLIALQDALRPELMVVKCRALHVAASRAIGDGGGTFPEASGGSAGVWSELCAIAAEPNQCIYISQLMLKN